MRWKDYPRFISTSNRQALRYIRHYSIRDPLLLDMNVIKTNQASNQAIIIIPSFVLACNDNVIMNGFSRERRAGRQQENSIRAGDRRVVHSFASAGVLTRTLVRP